MADTLSIALKRNLRQVSGEVGGKLRALRRAREMSQAEVGRACDPPVAHSMVSQWESGTVAASVDRVFDWSRIFRVPIGYFFGEIELEEEDLRGVNGTAVLAGGGAMADGGDRPRLPRSYDPDEPETPQGLEELIESGFLMTARELRELKAYADPTNGRRGASGARRWTAEQWLEVLMKERLEAWRERVREGKRQITTEDTEDPVRDPGQRHRGTKDGEAL